jgi:hypothetical protein
VELTRESNHILKEDLGLLLALDGKRLFIDISTKYWGKWISNKGNASAKFYENVTTLSKDMLQNFCQHLWHGPPCLFSHSDICTQYCYNSQNCSTGNARPIPISPQRAKPQHLQLWIHRRQIIIIIIIISRGQEICIPFPVQTITALGHALNPIHCNLYPHKPTCRLLI